MTEPTKKELDESAIKLGALFAVIGIVIMAFCGYIPLSVEVRLMAFVVGVGMAIFGVVVFHKGSEFGEDYVARKRPTLAEDSRGIVWVWVVALCTWAIMAIAYFSLSMVVYMVLDSVEAFYPWGTQELGVISLTRNVCAWFLIIMTVGIIGWALINSARKEDQTFGY